MTKKILLTLFALVFSCLSLTSFAFQTCSVGTSGFCQCFVSNCEAAGLPASQCTAANIKANLAPPPIGMGVDNVCHMQQPANYTQCVAASNYYIGSNSPCH